MSYAEIAASVMLIALVVYSLSGGADFGGGVWSLLSFGRSGERQRRLIDEAIAPIWEANHVWLILIVVLLFVCFPIAFSAASIALHVPITLMLIGVVLRGAGFVFRHYAADERMRRRWSRVFAASSAFTPFFLGVCLGAITTGSLRIVNGMPTTGFVKPWLNAPSLLIGVFAVSLFSFIAAVYLANETDDRELQEAFRARAIYSGLAGGALAFATILLTSSAAPRFFDALIRSPFGMPLQVITALVAASVLSALFTRRYRLARILVVVHITLVVGGWGAAQFPYLIAPDLTIVAAGASENVIRATLLTLAVGSVVLAPSFFYLYRLFKAQPE